MLLLIDAAYADYVDAADYDCGFDLAHEPPTTSWSPARFQALRPSGRIGWGYGPRAVIDNLQRIRTPFNTNAAALAAAAAAAVRDRTHAERVRQHNARWLKRLTSDCEALGLSVAPSSANFILIFFKSAPLDARQAMTFLAARGIIPRDLGAGAPDNTLRVTIGLDHENEAFLAALRAFMTGG